MYHTYENNTRQVLGRLILRSQQEIKFHQCTLNCRFWLNPQNNDYILCLDTGKILYVDFSECIRNKDDKDKLNFALVEYIRKHPCFFNLLNIASAQIRQAHVCTKECRVWSDARLRYTFLCLTTGSMHICNKTTCVSFFFNYCCPRWLLSPTYPRSLYISTRFQTNSTILPRQSKSALYPAWSVALTTFQYEICAGIDRAKSPRQTIWAHLRT